MKGFFSLSQRRNVSPHSTLARKCLRVGRHGGTNETKAGCGIRRVQETEGFPRQKVSNDVRFLKASASRRGQPPEGAALQDTTGFARRQVSQDGRLRKTVDALETQHVAKRRPRVSRQELAGRYEQSTDWNLISRSRPLHRHDASGAKRRCAVWVERLHIGGIERRPECRWG